MATVLTCTRCGTTKTTQWRNRGPGLLCNACGIRLGREKRKLQQVAATPSQTPAAAVHLGTPAKSTKTACTTSPCPSPAALALAGCRPVALVSRASTGPCRGAPQQAPAANGRHSNSVPVALPSRDVRSAASLPIQPSHLSLDLQFGLDMALELQDVAGLPQPSSQAASDSLQELHSMWASDAHPCPIPQLLPGTVAFRTAPPAGRIADAAGLEKSSSDCASSCIASPRALWAAFALGQASQVPHDELPAVQSHVIAPTSAAGLANHTASLAAGTHGSQLPSPQAGSKAVRVVKTLAALPDVQLLFWSCPGPEGVLLEHTCSGLTLMLQLVKLGSPPQRTFATSPGQHVECEGSASQATVRVSLMHEHSGVVVTYRDGPLGNGANRLPHLVKGLAAWDSGKGWLALFSQPSQLDVFADALQEASL